VLQLDQPGREALVRVSQGIHLVLHRSFLPGNAALMIPQTSDGRVLFALPWHNHLLVGTTDTPVNQHSPEPVAQEDEINFVLHNVSQYLSKQPQRSDVLSIFAGLRPLAAPQKEAATKEISRDHKLLVSPSGLITITGGKWTTYRKMAEDAVDKACEIGGLGEKPSVTKTLAIHGHTDFEDNGHWYKYGSDAAHIKALLQEGPQWSEVLVLGHPYTAAEVIWAVRQEMARTVEDVLARRLRLLFLDARAARNAAPKAATLMAAELGKDDAWVEDQLLQFDVLLKGYLPSTSTAAALA
jgi:glycerol-3-phosphate dehydrogenase